MYRKAKIHLQGETRKLTSLRPKEPAEAEPTARASLGRSTKIMEDSASKLTIVQEDGRCLRSFHTIVYEITLHVLTVAQ
jgi:hypothetical protein